MHASIYTESNTLPPLIIISQVHFMSLEATPLLALDSLTRRSISTTKFYVPSNMHASIYTESNTFPLLITISQVHFMNLEATPLLALYSLTRRSISRIFHCNQILRALKHACKQFYRIQHSPTYLPKTPRFSLASKILQQFLSLKAKKKFKGQSSEYKNRVPNHSKHSLW